MKFIVSILLTALLAFVACLYMDWWSIALAAFLVSAVIPQRPGRSFLTGFIALFLLWVGLSFAISNSNQHLLAHKVSILMIGMDSPYLLILATAVIGALVAGFASLAGSYIRMKPVNN